MKQVNLGLIGLGSQGKIHLTNCLRLEGASVVGVSDVSKKSLLFAKNMGVKNLYPDVNELLNNKRIFKIQLTGSNAPGEISEARTAYNYGLNLGIKKHLMLIEENTTTTTEQILFIKNQFPRSHGTTVLIISDQFHLTRALEICKFYNVKGVAVASDYDLVWKKLLYYRFRESVALLLFWLFAI